MFDYIFDLKNYYIFIANIILSSYRLLYSNKLNILKTDFFFDHNYILGFL